MDGVLVGDGSQAEPLRLYRRAFSEVGREVFTERFGSAFLVLYTSLDSLGAGPRTQVPRAAPGGFEDGPTADVGLYAVGIKKTPRCAFPFIALGRTANNDVVLRDNTVSKFHAFFRADADGQLTLTDAKSRNGTFVDESPVPQRGEGPPPVMGPRHVLRFGSIDAQFFLLQPFVEFLEAMAHGGVE